MCERVCARVQARCHSGCEMWSQQGVCLSPRAGANAATAAPSCLTETHSKSIAPASLPAKVRRRLARQGRKTEGWWEIEGEKERDRDGRRSEEGVGRGILARDVGDGRRKGNLCFALKADAGRSLINVRVQQPPNCLSTTAICYRFLRVPEEEDDDDYDTVRSQLCLLAHHYLKVEVENNSVLCYISQVLSACTRIILSLQFKRKISTFPTL